MKVLLDLNVLLDVIQRREPFYGASAVVLSQVTRGGLEACVPGHGLTTIYYLVARYASRTKANDAIDWLLGHLEVVAEGRSVFLRARSLLLADFEDAVTASAAEVAGCTYIISRNVADFADSPVLALTPEEFLALGADTDQPDLQR